MLVSPKKTPKMVMMMISYALVAGRNVVERVATVDAVMVAVVDFRVRHVTIVGSMDT